MANTSKHVESSSKQFLYLYEGTFVIVLLDEGLVVLIAYLRIVSACLL
jgi:hypothetical protein